MTKSELIDAIALRGKLSKGRAELVVNCVLDAMADALARGEGIEIRGFGSFSIREYEPYAGRNPRTGEPVQVRSKRLPFFKVGKELKALVDESRRFAITGGATRASRFFEPTAFDGSLTCGTLFVSRSVSWFFVVFFNKVFFRLI